MGPRVVQRWAHRSITAWTLGAPESQKIRYVDKLSLFSHFRGFKFSCEDAPVPAVSFALTLVSPHPDYLENSSSIQNKRRGFTALGPFPSSVTRSDSPSLLLASLSCGICHTACTMPLLFNWPPLPGQ